MLRIVDTSNNNPGVPNATLDCDGYIFKATEGVGYTDSDCAPSYAEAKAAGKLLGVYHFARPDGNDPIPEADWFVSQVRGYIGEAVLVLDWEVNPTNNVWWAKTWLDRVYAKTGVRPVIYMNTSTANAYDWSIVWTDYALWVAQYRDYVADYNWDMSGAGADPDVKWPNAYIGWQWTSSGRLNGYNGNLDCSVFYLDKTAWQAFAQGHPAETPAPVVTPEPVPAPVVTPAPVEPPVVTPPVVTPPATVETPLTIDTNTKVNLIIKLLNSIKMMLVNFIGYVKSKLGK